MLYLFIILALLLSIYHFDYLKKVRGRNITYFYFLIVFILVAGLRYRLGVDSIRYETAYTNIPSLFQLTNNTYSESRWDPAFFTLASVSKTFSSDFMMLQFLQAVFVNVVIFHFFKKYTQNIFFALLIYFIFLYLNFMCEVMRESCAVCCLLLAYPYFIRKNWIGYYAYSVLSILFHISAIITLALPLLYIPFIRPFFTVGKRTIFLLIAVFILGNIIRIILFDYLQTLTLLESLQDKATAYADSELADTTFNIKGIIGQLILYIVYPIIALIILKRNKKYGYNQVLDLMVTVGAYMAIFTIPIALFYRFNNYFSPFMIIAVSDIAFKSLKRRKHLYKLTFLTWLIIFAPWFTLRTYLYFSRISNTGLSDISRYYPYESRLYPVKDNKREKVFNYYNAE